MQTAKTAAVMVLMMSVLYGSYVSLTTPPEPVPDEIAEELVMDDDLLFDDGLPESLQSMGSESDLVATTDNDSGSVVAPQQLQADVEMPGDPTLGSANQDNLNAAVASLSAGAAKLPAATEPNPLEGSAGAQPKYQSTGSTFEVPDPKTVDFASSTTGGVELPDTAVSQTAAIQPSPNLGMVNALETADRQFGKDQLKDALATLSLFYNTPNMTSNERIELLSRLDPLAREVIYSRRHLLEQPHRVGQNETLEQIADTYKVPWQVLANINGITDPKSLLPGTELKVLRGPFNAQVNLDARELTLFLGDLYAGRFPIEIGNSPAPRIGSFVVQDKQTSRTYYGDAAPIPPGNPSNPYGAIWIDLGSQQCIHGSPDAQSPTDKGCISLAGDFADDLYGILSQGSSVTIRR